MHEEIEAEYDLKYERMRIAAPKLRLQEKVVDPAVEYGGQWHRAPVFLFGILSAHVFEDANKRTAWAVTIEYPNRQGLSAELSQEET